MVDAVEITPNYTIPALPTLPVEGDRGYEGGGGIDKSWGPPGGV
jgi:hypothetical protein